MDTGWSRRGGFEMIKTSLFFTDQRMLPPFTDTENKGGEEGFNRYLGI
jgi:hypothetical protein